MLKRRERESCFLRNKSNTGEKRTKWRDLHLDIMYNNYL